MFVFLSFVASALFGSARASAPVVGLAIRGGSNSTVDEVIEENPDYVVPDSDSDDEDSDAFDSDDEKSEEEEDENHGTASAKLRVSRALSKSRGKYKPSLKLLKKHRGKITAALAIFAFRRELLLAIKHIATKELIDPATGKVRVSPTAILKVILFVDFIRRLQAGTSISQDTLTTLGQNNPMVGILFSKFLRLPVFNPAYLPPISQHYTFERLNERYVKDGMALHKAVLSQHRGFSWPTSEKALTPSMMKAANITTSAASKDTGDTKPVVVVLDWTEMDTSVSNMASLRDQVSFLLSEYREAAFDRLPTAQTDSNTTEAQNATEVKMEVVVLLESPGGSAADYALAAEHLWRLRREAGIQLTICVDKVAASGGYMMACVASPGQLLAAPFALVGSIGVIGQVLNFQELLKGWKINAMVFRGGRDKAPLGQIGDVTQAGKARTQKFVDATHKAFKNHVVEARPQLEPIMAKVGSGNVFMGQEALANKLIDRLVTSDVYLGEKIEDGARVLKMVQNKRTRLLFGGASPGLEGRHRHSVGTIERRASETFSFLRGFWHQLSGASATTNKLF